MKLPITEPKSVDKPGRGGRRAGAGRKRDRQNQQDPKHEKREPLETKHPIHVMLRTCDDVPRLRQRRMYEAIREALLRYVDGRHFRVVHISLQQSHIHMIVEAANAEHLSRGMQSFAINAARAINGKARRRGKVFRFRYKAKQLRTREYARNAIAYVLNNWRRHRQDARSTASIDEFSSAISFTGWARVTGWKVPAGYQPLPVSKPRTHLLRTDWQWLGLISPFEIPGPACC
jgi:putative transposase